MLVENWKFRCQPQCHANFNVASTGKPVAQLEITRENTLVLLKPANLWGYTWKDLITRIVKIIFEEQGWVHWTWCTNLFLCLKPWKYQKQGQQWRKNGKHWRKYPHGSLTKVRNKSEVIAEARNKGHTVHFASLMELCHLKNSELEPQFQEYKGRVVLRGDIVKVDSGSYAVFTEQGSSASQMTAAKVMDVKSRLPRCEQQTQYLLTPRSKWKMHHHFWKFRSQNVQIFRFVYHDTNGQKSWSSMEDPVVPLERNLYGHPLAGLLWERQFEKVLLEHGWEKVPNWECLFVHRWKRKGFFLSVYVDDLKLAGKKQNIDPMSKILMKDVDLGEPTSFFDHVYLGCTQRECQDKQRYCGQPQEYVWIQDLMLWATEKLLCSEKTWGKHFLMVLWHGRSCKEMRGKIMANWRTKQTWQLHKVATPCMDDHQFKEEEKGSVGELSKVCSQIVLKCLYLGRIGGRDILWSVNKFARAVTNWTRACVTNV